MTIFINSFLMIAGIVLSFIFTIYVVGFFMKLLEALKKAAIDGQRRKLDIATAQYITEKRAALRRKAVSLMENNPQIAEVVGLLAATPYEAKPRERAKLTARMRKLVSQRHLRDALYRISEEEGKNNSEYPAKPHV